MLRPKWPNRLEHENSFIPTEAQVSWALRPSGEVESWCTHVTQAWDEAGVWFGLVKFLMFQINVRSIFITFKENCYAIKSLYQPPSLKLWSFCDFRCGPLSNGWPLSHSPKILINKVAPILPPVEEGVANALLYLFRGLITGNLKVLGSHKLNLIRMCSP